MSSNKDREIVYYGPSNSFRVGELSEGCVRCIDGEKVVLYTTGSCSVGCAYCPIPEDKQKKNDVFINERKISLDHKGDLDLVDESDICLATGAGITGGDPMEVPQRTINYIKKLREQYGPDYHLHLYTSGVFFKSNPELIDQLFNAGLDELRFHPKQIRAKPIWQIAADAKKKYPHKLIGFEIPVIPQQEEVISELILFADKVGMDFVNLNEYEFTSSNFNKLSQRGFVSVLSNSAISGSYETAQTVINKVKDTTSISIHFCSSGSKDSIQLVQRFKRRASQIKRPFDDISDEGELEFGRIYLNNLDDINRLADILEDNYELDDELYQVNKDLLVIETGWFVIKEIIEDLREKHFPGIQAEIIAQHPIENGPITWIEPL